MTEATNATTPNGSTADITGDIEAKGNDLLSQATETASDLLNTATATSSDLIANASKAAGLLFGQAQEAIEAAVETTVKAVKEHPVAAAGIAAGAAAAVAGAAFGVSKLLEDNEPPTKKK